MLYSLADGQNLARHETMMKGLKLLCVVVGTVSLFVLTAVSSRQSPYLSGLGRPLGKQIRAAAHKASKIDIMVRSYSKEERRLIQGILQDAEDLLNLDSFTMSIVLDANSDGIALNFPTFFTASSPAVSSRSFPEEVSMRMS